jgi:hypothetical protein
VKCSKKDAWQVLGVFEKARRQNPNREKGYRGDIAAVCAKLNTFIDVPRRTNDLVSTGLQLRPVAQRETPVCSRSGGSPPAATKH